MSRKIDNDNVRMWLVHYCEYIRVNISVIFVSQIVSFLAVLYCSVYDICISATVLLYNRATYYIIQHNKLN